MEPSPTRTIRHQTPQTPQMEVQQIDYPYFAKGSQYPVPSGDMGCSFGDITGVYDDHGPIFCDQDGTNFDVDSASMWPEYSYTAKMSE